MSRLPNLNLLIALDALLSEGSVTGAADRMFLSKPAMSHTLARLREVFDDPILVKSGRKLVPTQKALDLREPVRKLISDATSIIQRVTKNDLSQIEREFTVSAPAAIPLIFGATIYKTIAALMPRVQVRFTPPSRNAMVQLRSELVSLVISAEQTRSLREGNADGEIRSQVLYEQRLLGVRLRAGLSPNPTLEQFAEMEHITVYEGLETERIIDAQLREAGCRRHVRMGAPDYYSALVTVSKTPLVAIVPVRMYRSMSRFLPVESFELPCELESQWVNEFWHVSCERDAAHEVMRATIQSILQAGAWAIPIIDDLAR